MIETAGMLIDADEPTYGMSVGEDERGFWTRLLVNRGDQLVTAEILHGPDPEYSGKIPPLGVPSLGEMKVGEMLEESQRHRHDLTYYIRAKEQLAGSTLISDAIRRDEEARYAIKNRSTFGPKVVKQRGGYSHETFEREWMDERARRTGKRTYSV